jgi:hypothetical protein
MISGHFVTEDTNLQILDSTMITEERASENLSSKVNWMLEAMKPTAQLWPGHIALTIN